MNFKEKILMKISFYLSFVFKELKKKINYGKCNEFCDEIFLTNMTTQTV